MSKLQELTHGQVHLWSVLTDDAKRRGWISRYQDLLTPEERARHQQFAFEKDRDQFLIARALLRTTLSHYSDTKPDAWQFKVNEFGKPSIKQGESDSGIRFNLSHCAGLLICGVTLGCEIGVDCENTDRDVEFEQLAPRVFSPSELEYFQSMPASKRKELFFRLWTLKEAYIKARGIGLSLPLQKFSIDNSQTPSIKIAFDREIRDQPQMWKFFEPIFPKPFIAAVATNVPTAEPIKIVHHSA